MKKFGLVVIGAHFGVWLNDDLSKFDKENILLVEPVPYNHKKLKERFTNLSNKILIFNFTGSLTKTMNLDLKDAQDMTIFNENLYVSNTNNRSLIRYNFLSKFINEINLTKFTKNNLLLCKAVCNDSLGNTYISDFKKCIVLKFLIWQYQNYHFLRSFLLFLNKCRLDQSSFFLNYQKSKANMHRKNLYFFFQNYF